MWSDKFFGIFFFFVSGFPEDQLAIKLTAGTVYRVILWSNYLEPSAIAD